MNDERPEALLRSALEKIIYFEARSEQINSDLQQSREEVERVKRALSAAAEREIALRAQIAELEVKSVRLTYEREEQLRVNEALRRERKDLIGKLIDASRLHDSEDDGADGLDLASFISELRHEALRGTAVAPAAAPAQELAVVAAVASAPSAAASAVARHAERFAAQGRLDISAQDLHALATEAGQPLPAEETLFGFSVRELSAAAPTSRMRAAERLRSLGNAAAAPALAGALHAESNPEVVVTMLDALAPLAGAEGISVVLPHLTSASPDVRISALKAVMLLDAGHAAPYLQAALKDPDRAVRKRASLLALGLAGEDALRLGEEAGRDVDPKVRSLGALALAAAGGTRARNALTSMLHDSDAHVRESASKSLSRILGKDVSAVVSLEDAQRRREIRRLASLPSNPVLRVERPAVPESTAPRPRTKSDAELLCASVLSELRISIRGRTVTDIAQTVNATLEHVEEACALLAARSQAVRRGLKYFVA